MAAILALEKISKKFGAVVVADEIDLSLNEGEALGIIGPNGAGKTTLFGIAAGVTRPDSGRVLFAQNDVTKLPAEQRWNALAALALHAGLERGVPAAVTGMAPLAAGMKAGLKSVAGAVRSGGVPAPFPPLRQMQLALAPTVDTVVVDETDLMVDSINTMADLLSSDGH